MTEANLKLPPQEPDNPRLTLRFKKRGWQEPKPCEHGSFIVDENLRQIECGKCGHLMDPFEAMVILCKEETNLEYLCKRQHELLFEVDERKRVRQEACKHTKMSKMRNIHGGDGGSYCPSCNLRINPKVEPKP